MPRSILVPVFLVLAAGCARRDYVVHYPTPTASASVYVEPSAAPSVHNSTVTYETYAETYEEVWVEDPTYGRVLEICPATVSEWDGYNIVQQIVVTPRGRDLRNQGRFVYNGSWLWVPGFNALPRAAVTFSAFHRLPRYQTYRRRHQPRRVISPRIARARVRPRTHIRTSPRRTNVHVRSPGPTLQIHGKPVPRRGRALGPDDFSNNRPHRAEPAATMARPPVHRQPTPEPDVRIRHTTHPRHHAAPPRPQRVVQPSSPPAFGTVRTRSTTRNRPAPSLQPARPTLRPAVSVARPMARPGFSRPVQTRPSVSKRSSKSSGSRLKREPSRRLRSTSPSKSRRRPPRSRLR